MLGPGEAFAQDAAKAKQAKQQASGAVRSAQAPAPSGIGIDATGGPTIDPTENVKALVAAEKQRSDDLRQAEKERIRDTQEWQVRYFDSMLTASKEISAMRAAHQSELRANDIERNSNIRQVDITNADSAAAATQIAIKALAEGVESTRATLAEAQSQLAARVDERLGALERSASLGEGKQRVSDPAIDSRLAALSDQVERLARLQAAGTGKSEGSVAMWGYVAAGVGFVIALGALYSMVKRFDSRNSTQKTA